MSWRRRDGRRDAPAAPGERTRASCGTPVVSDLCLTFGSYFLRPFFHAFICLHETGACSIHVPYKAFRTLCISAGAATSSAPHRNTAEEKSQPFCAAPCARACESHDRADIPSRAFFARSLPVCSASPNAAEFEQMKIRARPSGLLCLQDHRRQEVHHDRSCSGVYEPGYFCTLTCPCCPFGECRSQYIIFKITDDKKFITIEKKGSSSSRGRTTTRRSSRRCSTRSSTSRSAPRPDCHRAPSSSRGRTTTRR